MRPLPRVPLLTIGLGDPEDCLVSPKSSLKEAPHLLQITGASVLSVAGCLALLDQLPFLSAVVR